MSQYWLERCNTSPKNNFIDGKSDLARFDKRCPLPNWNEARKL